MTKIIAEVGSNHLGDYNLIYTYISEAKERKLDILKFQGFRADTLDLTKGYTLKDKEYYKQCEIDFVATVIKCTNSGVQPLITAFDLKNIQNISMAMNYAKKKVVKIASPDMLSFALIDSALRLFDEVIISTGMHTTIEISRLCSYIRSIGQAHKVVLMHCVSKYPTPSTDVNMVMAEYIKEMGFRWGFSDHTESLDASIVAISMGAEDVEKHVTLSKYLGSRDAYMSASFDELGKLVEFAKKASEIRGEFTKKELDENDKQMRCKYIGKWNGGGTE